MSDALPRRHAMWLVLAATYGVSQWVILRRRHREQRQQIHVLVGTNEQLQCE